MSTLADAVADLVGVGAHTDEHSVLEHAVDTAVRATGAASGAAVLLGPTGATHVAGTGEVARRLATPPAAPSPVPPPSRRGGPRPLPREVGDVVRTRCLVHRSTPTGPTLGAPIAVDGDLLGVLSLQAPAGRTFTADDEALVSGLARQAAWAVTGIRARRSAADLGRRLDGPVRAATTAALRGAAHDEEPLRAVDRILDVARTHLGMQLAIVSRIEGGVQRFERMSGSAAPFGLAVGQEVPLERTYCQAVLDGRISGLVPDAAADAFASARNRENGVDIGAYAGVPLRTSDGDLYGSLCTLSPHAAPLVPGDLAFLRVLGDLVGDQLARHRRREEERRARDSLVAACLAPGGLQVVVQPVADLVEGRVSCVEALSRFPAAGSPADVFAAAHDAGLGCELELHAVDAALALLPQLPADVHLSVNASPATLLDERLLRRLADVPPGRLVVEITEHAAVPDYPPLLAVLEQLAASGIAVAVDDAGSGFASLQHVLAISPQLIKLDVGLVRGIDADPSRRALARAMVLFAEELGARLVAEGVETAAELETLRGLGVRYVQGFHLARPAPLAEHDLHRRTA